MLAQVLGIVREIFLASQVGVSGDLDALLIALALPAALAAAITSGTTRALVPAYMDALESGGREDARQLAGTVLGWTGLAGVTTWLALVAFAGPMISVAGPGLTLEGRVSATAYLALLAPMAFIGAISAIMAAICQAAERFHTLAVATFAGSAANLAAMLLLWPRLGLTAFAVANIAGPVVSLVILVASCVRGSLMPMPVPRRDVRLRPLIRHAAPIALSAAILQLNVIGDRAIASLLGPGAVSALRYADVLVRAPIGAIGPAWGSAIFPALVRSTYGKAGANLADGAERALRYMIAIFVPITMLTMAVAPVAVSVAFGRGAFAAQDVNVTAAALAGFAPLLVIVMMLTVLTGAHNARRRGQLLLVGGTINVVLNIALDLLLGRLLGVAGIALASSISQGVVTMLFLVRLSRSEDPFRLRPLARTFVLAMLASTPVAVATAILAWTGVLPHDTFQGGAILAVVGVMGGMGYLTTAAVIGMAEPKAMALVALNWLRLRRKLRP